MGASASTARADHHPEFPIGLSAAILLGAMAVRALFAPATMKLLRRWNWYRPAGAQLADAPAPAEP